MKKKLSILLTMVFLFSVSQSAPGLLSFLSSAYADSPQLEKRITGNGHTYYFFSSDYTWTAANAYAKSIGGHLATITSEKEQCIVQSLVEDYGGAWLGGTDEEEEGTWKWVTGEAFSYQHWQAGQPDNEDGIEHYLQIFQDGDWNDLNFDGDYNRTGFVVEFDSIFDIDLNDDPTDDLKRIPVIKYKEHYYTTFTDNMTWEEAREFCEYYGGHLVTITSGNEQSFIVEKFCKINTENNLLCCGLFRSDDGSWIWVTGEDVVYDYGDFLTGEGEHAGQDYMYIYTSLFDDESVGLEEDQLIGEWLSHDNYDSSLWAWNTGSAGSICEWESLDDAVNCVLVVVDSLTECEKHTWDEGTVSENPTCQQTGVKVYHCEVCGEEKTEPLPKLDHDLHHVVNPATCTIKGLAYDVCSMCNTIFNKVVIPKLPHQTKTVEVVTKQPTCTEDGKKTVTVKCKVCGEIISEKTETIPANGQHVWDGGTVAEEPTCQQAGLKIYLCEVCGEMKKETLPKVDHDLHHVTNPATCTIEGVEYDVCTMCDTIFNQVITPKLPHPWGEGVVTREATCDKDGEITYTCTVCGEKKTEAIPSGGAHQWDDGKVTKAATCQEEGVTTYTCAKCGATKTEAIAKTAHSFGPWKFIKVPNYREGGQAQRTCKVCGFLETKDYDKVIPDHVKEDEDTDVAIGYMDDTYNSDIELRVTNVFDGSSYNFLNKEKTNFQFEIYDIATLKDGQPVQPNGKVLVKLPIPADYSRDHLVIYYVTNTGVIEKMDMWIEGDFACFEAEHFSAYALVDESKEVIRLGDVDGDGEISSADARLALRRSVQLEDYAMGSVVCRACDVDLDGEVSSADARSILRVSVKLEKEDDWKK